MGSGQQFDFLVIGAGVAGLRAAIELASFGNVLVVTKESVRESNTHYAQGGIAVAEAQADEIALHLQDTVHAGDGLVYGPAAQALVNEGPQRVAELIAWGAHFDQDHGVLLRTREAAHSRPRILHANGDATGAEISRSLAALARTHASLQFAEWTTVTQLLVTKGRVAGAELLDREQRRMRVMARAVLVAAGGAGQVYADTTNPAVATGDGIALALRAGAELADMEFYQFHPTALSLPGVPRFLLSEALRGEGAWLRNAEGERFMERYSPMLELAPRDVVARAVAREGMGATPGETRPVYLDMRHVTEMDLHARFPGISAFLAQHRLDLHRDLIPIRPAAHYLMGGIRTDLDGRTSLPGLYAAGEAACTGLHGANRLASNSLLEGLVYGARAAKAMLTDALPRSDSAITSDSAIEMLPSANGIAADGAQDRVRDRVLDEEQLEAWITSLREAMGHYAGLVREDALLREGIAAHEARKEALSEMTRRVQLTRRVVEAQSLCAIAEVILRSALARTESRGGHFRTDYPRRNDAEFCKHSAFRAGEPIRFEAWS